MCAAERLYAAHGLDGVSLRHIATAVGNGNNSVVQYHFGSRDGLIEAIFQYRLPRLNERRMLLVAERPPDDVRSWVECQLRALLEQSELDGSHYLGFVEVLYQHGRRDLFDLVPTECREDIARFHQRLSALLGHIEETLRTHRIARAMALIVHAAADRERARANGQPVLPFAVELNGLVDGMVGFLEAPVSPLARATLDQVGGAGVRWPMFL